MTTEYLQKSPDSAVLDECSSWIERIQARLAGIIGALCNGSVRQARLSQLRKLSPRQLRDIGLDDPQVQIRLLDTQLESERENLEGLRNRLQVLR